MADIINNPGGGDRGGGGWIAGLVAIILLVLLILFFFPSLFANMRDGAEDVRDGTVDTRDTSGSLVPPVVNNNTIINATSTTNVNATTSDAE